MRRPRSTVRYGGSFLWGSRRDAGRMRRQGLTGVRATDASRVSDRSRSRDALRLDTAFRHRRENGEAMLCSIQISPYRILIALCDGKARWWPSRHIGAGLVPCLRGHVLEASRAASRGATLLLNDPYHGARTWDDHRVRLPMALRVFRGRVHHTLSAGQSLAPPRSHREFRGSPAAHLGARTEAAGPVDDRHHTPLPGSARRLWAMMGRRISRAALAWWQACAARRSPGWPPSCRCRAHAGASSRWAPHLERGVLDETVGRRHRHRARHQARCHHVIYESTAVRFSSTPLGAPRKAVRWRSLSATRWRMTLHPPHASRRRNPMECAGERSGTSHLPFSKRSSR